MEKEDEEKIKKLISKEIDSLKRVIEIMKGKIFNQEKIIQSQNRKINSLESLIKSTLNSLKK